MAWIALTEARLQNRLSSAEFTAVTTAAKQSAQTAEDILADAISAVTAEVRGYVAGCDKNSLGYGETIPKELESAALALLRRYLFTRLPGMKSLYDQIRQDETKDALALLRDVAACRFAIVPPETAAEEQAAAATPSIGSKCLKFTRQDQEGL